MSKEAIASAKSYKTEYTEQIIASLGRTCIERQVWNIAHKIYFLFELMSVVTWSILWRSASLILVLSIMLSEPLQLGHLKNNSTATSNFTRGQSRLPQW